VELQFKLLVRKLVGKRILRDQDLCAVFSADPAMVVLAAKMKLLAHLTPKTKRMDMLMLCYECCCMVLELMLGPEVMLCNRLHCVYPITPS